MPGFEPGDVDGFDSRASRGGVRVTHDARCGMMHLPKNRSSDRSSGEGCDTSPKPYGDKTQRRIQEKLSCRK